MGNSRSIKRKRDRQTRRPERTLPQSPGSDTGRYTIRIGAAVALVALVAFIVVDAGGDPPAPAEAPEGTEVFAVAAPAHVTGPVSYPQDPPVGGPHGADDISCRTYDEPVVNEPAVHSLEHGAVWITYSPDLPPSEIETLVGKGGEREVMVSPYPGLDSPVVASAWGRQLRLDSADDDRLDQFISAFRDGQQSPEPHAAC